MIRSSIQNFSCFPTTSIKLTSPISIELAQIKNRVNAFISSSKDLFKSIPSYLRSLSLHVGQTILISLKNLSWRIDLVVASLFEGKREHLLNTFIAKGELEGVDFLLKSGVDVNNCMHFQKLTPLHIAALKNQLPIAQLLLNKGANRDVLSIEGMTPGLVALSKGYEELADILGVKRPFSQDWLAHKMINHRFGLEIQVSHSEQNISLSSFLGGVTYPVLLDSITCLADKWLRMAPPDWQEEDTQTVLKAIEQAIFLTQETLSLEQKIQQSINQAYPLVIPFTIEDNQKTSHANVLILTSDYLIKGDRSPVQKDEEENIVECGRGLELGRLEQPDKNKELIKQILHISGTEKSVQFFHSALSEKVVLPTLSLHQSIQHSNVCAWASSAKLAFRGVLLAQLLNKGYATQEAFEYSYLMYKHWAALDRIDSLKNYINQVEENHTKNYILACIYKFLKGKQEKENSEFQDILLKRLLPLIESQAPKAVALSNKIILNEKNDIRTFEQNASSG